MGIEVIAVTYDSPEELATFKTRRNIDFALFHDPQSQLIKSLGILNPGPEPDSSYYGIPLPGMMLVDKNGVIQAKFAEESYKLRPDYPSVLEQAEKLVP